MRISDWSSDVCSSDLLARGKGVMLPFDPCIRLQSNRMTVPGLPMGATMPWAWASSARLSSSGTPYSCFLSDILYWLSGVSPTQEKKTRCERGITIHGPFFDRFDWNEVG